MKRMKREDIAIGGPSSPRWQRVFAVLDLCSSSCLAWARSARRLCSRRRALFCSLLPYYCWLSVSTAPTFSREESVRLVNLVPSIHRAGKCVSVYGWRPLR